MFRYFSMFAGNARFIELFSDCRHVFERSPPPRPLYCREQRRCRALSRRACDACPFGVPQPSMPIEPPLAVHRDASAARRCAAAMPVTGTL
jgi:hypothetical protein